MVKTIIDSLFRRQEAATVTRCIGRFYRENMSARILEVRDRAGLTEHWIDVEWREGDLTWSTLGFFRVRKLNHQLDVMRQAHEYLEKFSA